jgi:UDP-N-acetyl-D-glucosamine dehydrogenase
MREGDYEIGRNIFVAFSPERVDPGNPKFGTRNTPKVLGGMTPKCLEVAASLYRQIVDTVVPVSSTDAAEMVKLLENTFRAVNIGLANEFALICERLGLDVWEVVHAAASKPFGFMPFYPGPGLGGHCIPIDPLYLSWRMRGLKMPARFIELADMVNTAMPEHVVQLVASALNDKKKAVKGAKVLISGVAYKRDVSDVRESPAIDVIDGLLRRGANVSYLDPWVPSFKENGHVFETIKSDASFADYDAVVIVTDHKSTDYARMLEEADLVIDTRNATRAHGAGAKATIVRI